jgi:hypothetical protein
VLKETILTKVRQTDGLAPPAQLTSTPQFDVSFPRLDVLFPADRAC